MPPPPLWTELTQDQIALVGGAAPGPGGSASKGGVLHLVSRGDQTLDPTLPPVPAAPDATPPTPATSVSSSALGSDVAAGSTAVIDGQLTTGGADAVRKIIVNSGDLYVTGVLRSTVVGGARQAIDLEAASGTVFISGTVDTSGAAGSAEVGGAITVVGRRVVITGAIASAGGSAPGTAGAAGPINIQATDSIIVSGRVDAFGGDGHDNAGGAVTGGRAGDTTLQAGGDITVAGTLRLRGGGATSTTGDDTGGAAATLKIDADGAVQIAGKIDARGGIAVSSPGGGHGEAGAAGSLLIGESAPSATIAILVPVALNGGDGQAVGGPGGLASFQPVSGAITLAGPREIDATGGRSSLAPGVGGTIQGSPTSHTATLGVHVTGEIVADGGSVVAGGSGKGGDAGSVLFEETPTLAPILIDASAKVSVTGGRSGGAAVAGVGGHVFLWTSSGDLTVAGTISALGGDAPDSGGTGGMGGFVYCFSDWDHDARFNTLGHLLIAPTGVIDSSGGSGTTGGSARSDGKVGLVPVFPDNQEQISIFLNCDGIHGDTLNWLSNQGHLIARGGAHNGNGGDIVYHGIAPDRNPKPPSGNIDNSADRTGQAGDFGGE